jgi:hypothetical protein
MWDLLIADHLDQSLWSTNEKYWTAVRSNLLHSYWDVHNCVMHFTSHGKLHEFGAEKRISWAKSAHFDFFKINFTVWSHILRTLRDALSLDKMNELGRSLFFLMEKSVKCRPQNEACIKTLNLQGSF